MRSPGIESSPKVLGFALEGVDPSLGSTPSGPTG
jgi:hypothetical protein